MVYDVTDADRSAFGALKTPGQRADEARQREPYRTLFRRADVEIHDKRLRWRRRMALEGPLLERAAEECIRDLARLLEKRRGVSQ
jgi:hypothetical protein